MSNSEHHLIDIFEINIDPILIIFKMPIGYLFTLQEKRDRQEREDAQERQENMTYVPFTCNVAMFFYMVIIMMVTCSSVHSPYVILYLSLRDTIGEFPVFPDTHLAFIIIITFQAFGEKQTNKQSTNACISPETTSSCGRNVHLNDIELLVTR